MPSKLNIGPEIKYKVYQCTDSPSPLNINNVWAHATVLIRVNRRHYFLFTECDFNLDLSRSATLNKM